MNILRELTSLSSVPDEASSALDEPSEQDFLQRLHLTLKSKDNNLAAVLFITHKKSVLRACDRVAVLSNGRIADMGVFDSLDPKRVPAKEG